MEGFEQRMEALRSRFAERCATDAARLKDAWAARDLRAVEQLVHGLAGSAGIFGHDELSSAASETERAMAEGLADHLIEPQIEALVRTLRTIARQSRDTSGASAHWSK